MFVKYLKSFVKMKNYYIRIIGMLFPVMFCSVVSAKTYYVAPTGGSDFNLGDITHPWATWQKGFSSANAGDTVYFRGGIWYPAKEVYGGAVVYLAPQYGYGHTGTRENPICFFNYPGETPILDCSLITKAAYSGINALQIEGAEEDNHAYATHYILKGLTVRNLPQQPDIRMRGFIFLEVGNIDVIQCVSHDIGGEGFVAMSYDTINFINCDSYNHYDIAWTNPDIGIADGFFLHDANAGGVYPYNYCTVTGCRAWNCRDDGFDIGGQSEYYVHNNWSFSNGGTGTGDPGSGFKFSGSFKETYTAKIITNNIAAFNHYGNGIEFNNLHQYIPGLTLGKARGSVYNNTIFKCYTGTGNSPWAYDDIAYVKYGNNLIYGCWGPVENPGYYAQTYFTRHLLVSDFMNNTWLPIDMGDPGWVTNPAYSVSEDDFVLTDSIAGIAEMTASRKSNGSLPDITFLTLKAGSDLIDRGGNVGLPYYGVAPDLGYAEYQSGSTTPASPTYIRSVIENNNPSRLEITFNLPLANIVPTPSAFIVMVNSSTRTVSSVTISGTKVLLTLTSPISFGNLVTVAYNKPATNQLQSSSGGQVASISAQNVINNVAAVSPVYISSVIENATPSRLEITFNLTLANIVPTPSAFIVMVNSSARTVGSVTISGTKVLLTLTSPISFGNLVTVAYNKPATNQLQSSSDGQVASISAQNVINNVAAVSPVYISSVIENATPSRLEMTFNLTLANIVPTPSAFTVMVNSSARAVFSVAISGTKVLLTLATPVTYGDLVTIAYTKPASNQLQTAEGGQAVSFTAQSVINNCSLIANQSPSVKISSPTKSTSFISPATITIDAIASDSDGTISKVEFYSGSNKLGERTLVPYSYTWKDVTEGTYSITVVATDNLNAKTVSDVVSVIVEKSGTTINQLPIISITSPSKGKKHNKHDNVIIEAVASDPDGTITKVELKSGSTTIAELTVAPFIYVWEDVDTGSYIISATATDDRGATSNSSEIEFDVIDFYDPSSEKINLYPNPNNGHFVIDICSDLPGQNNKIAIVNLSGKIILTDVIGDQEIFKEFDISKKVAGTYVLMITNNNTIVATKKFIKN
jgi:uncharacterized repeat protein (TIGR02059 family)